MSEWITNAIINQHIQQYDYSEFKNVTKFEEGAFSYIKCADWPCSERKVVLKELKDYDVRELVKEVKIHSSSHSSEHVVRFFGLTKESPDKDSYMMVMEYADGRSLRNFLKQGEDVDINWEMRYKFSLDIAKGLYCLHSRNIVHRDLHTNNIVIKRTNVCCRPKFIAQITDFGGATSINEGEHGDSEDVGQIAFTDPKILDSLGKYKKDLRSDIYSIGVIFWEISSGRIPFKGYMTEINDSYRDLCLTLAIINGLREIPISSTPENYSSLYQNCWKHELSERPTVEKIIKILNIGLTKFLEQNHELKGNDGAAMGTDLNYNNNNNNNNNGSRPSKRPKIDELKDNVVMDIDLNNNIQNSNNSNKSLSNILNNDCDDNELEQKKVIKRSSESFSLNKKKNKRSKK